MSLRDDIFYGLSLLAILSIPALGIYIVNHESPKGEIANLEPLRREISVLREELAQAAASRCMTINTERLDIYQVPNLGVKKVSKP